MPLDEIPTPTIQTKDQLLDRLKGGTAEILLYRDMVETFFSFFTLTVESTDLNIVMNPLFKGYDVEPIWSGVGTGEARVGWSVFPIDGANHARDSIVLEREWASGGGVAYTSGYGGFPRWSRIATSAADQFLQQRPWGTSVAGVTYDIGYEVQENDAGGPAGFLRFEFVNNSAGAGAVVGAQRTAAGSYTESLTWGASNTTLRFRFDNDCIGLSVKGPVRVTPSKSYLLTLVGKKWIVNALDATGAWAGRTGQIAVATVHGWVFFRPVNGLVAYIEEEKRSIRYSDTDGWRLLDPAGVPNPRKYYESVYPTTTMFTTKTDKFTLHSEPWDGVTPPIPPYDILTPASYYSDPDAITIRRGTFIVEPRGGAVDDSRFPRFWVNDTWWEDSISFGVNPIDNTGSPRGGIDGGLDIYSTDTIDTTEIRGGSGYKNEYGRIDNWSEGSQAGVFRVYSDTLCRNPTSDRVLWFGRGLEWLWEERPTLGATMRLIGVPIGGPQTDRRDIIKFEQNPLYTFVAGTGLSPIFFKPFDDEWRQIEMKPANAHPGATYSYLVIQNT